MREFPSPAQVLEIFQQNPEKLFRLRELVQALGLRSSQARELKRALKELSRKRRIVYLKKNRFELARRGVAPHAPSTGAPPRERGAASAPKIPERRNVVVGRLIGHRDGYGFVVPDDPSGTNRQDIYIRRDGIGSAMHGDRVEVHVIRSSADGRMEGRVVRVAERAQKTVVGEFRCGPRFNYVLPFDHRIPHEIIIPRGQERPVRGEELSRRHRQFGGESEGKHGGSRPAGSGGDAHALDKMIVDVELIQYPAPSAPPRGRVAEVLGRREDFGVDVEIMIRKFHLAHRFPPEVLVEAEATAQIISEADRAGRGDFRGLPIATIDGETAKDFDDAVYVERRAGGGYLLQVHIADVAHYVRPGSALDREARLRGTSVYFPDRAVPMLPLELSNGICSLNPKVDRLTMSVLMEIDAEGRITRSQIVPGIIRSAERMTYTAVRDVLAGERSACERYRPLAPHFRLMEELALILNRRRDQRGSIDFDLPEPEIEFDEHGRMVGVTRSERSIAHRIIEEFMLAANETVATALERHAVPSLYRIHEKPDPKKVLEFEEIAATFGYSLGVTLPSARRARVRFRDERARYPRFHESVETEEIEITPFHYQQLTERIAGKPEERILSYLMLRSLKQARYAEENTGHFALASPTYTHFTSPIRRYPDLIVHRILKAALEKDGGKALAEGAAQVSGASFDGLTALSGVKGRRGRPPGERRPARNEPHAPGGTLLSAGELRALALETSESERRAQEAERELMDWKKVAFMAGRLGEEFDALVISLTKHGFFVELIDLFVEGFVPIASLHDDRYIYRERLRAIVGERSKGAYRLGQRIRVRLERIDRSGNKLEFGCVD